MMKKEALDVLKNRRTIVQVFATETAVTPVEDCSLVAGNLMNAAPMRLGWSPAGFTVQRRCSKAAKARRELLRE